MAIMDGAGAWTFLLRCAAHHALLRSTGIQSAVLRDGNAEWSLQLVGDHRRSLQISRKSGSAAAAAFAVTLSSSLVPARRQPTKSELPELIQTMDGLPPNGRYNALFDLQKDVLLVNGAGVQMTVDRGKAALRIRPGDGGTLQVAPDYYRLIGVPYYSPFRSPFPGGKIHTGWMDWYFTYGQMNEEFMLRNLAWMKEHLQPFGVDVFQLDMYWYRNNNYRELDPKKFKHTLTWYVQQVKNAGFVPGIWVGPWARDNSMAVAHPEWFLHDHSGKLIRDWPNDSPNESPLLDATNPAALSEMSDLFHYLRDTVGFHYFKLDGQPVYWGRLQNSALFRKEIPPVDAYRTGYRTIRQAIGGDFLLSCWGIVPQGMGIANGSRTGGDVDLNNGLYTAADTTARWLFLNRNCWFADPDVLEVRSPEPLEKARAWASLLALSGQMLMMSDDMPALTADRVEILKRVIPVAALRPVNLYSQSRADVVDARIQRPWETWDVVGLFNFGRAPAERSLNLAALGLQPGRYIAYDFWNHSLAGIFSASQAFTVPPEGCRLLALRPLQRHPQILSTSRHVTQGGIDLQTVSWSSNRLSGASRVVENDPYTITVSLPEFERRYSIRSVRLNIPGTRPTVRLHGSTADVSFTSGRSGVVKWRIDFDSTPAGRIEPRAPSDLRATYLPRQGTLLAWKSQPGPAIFVVERDGNPIGVSTDGEYVDSSVKPFGRHSYRVTAQGWNEAAAASRIIEIVLPPPGDLYLGALTPESEHQGFGNLSIDRSVDGRPLAIHGVVYAHGLGTHSTTGGVGEQIYDLQGQFKRFTASVGIDDETKGRGSVVFQVWVDGVKRYDSGIVRGGEAARTVDVDIHDAHSLRLVVTDAGDGFEFDHADWADARLIAP